MAVSDLTALEAFLAEPRNAIMIGLRRDGRPHATPNWFLWEHGRFFISTTRTRAKHRIFTADPRVQLVVDDSTGFRYVVIDGTVSVVDDVEAGLDHFGRLRAKHGRGGATTEELRAEMQRDGRVTLVIRPDAGPSEWLSLGL